jgi:hypothetical protein
MTAATPGSRRTSRSRCPSPLHLLAWMPTRAPPWELPYPAAQPSSRRAMGAPPGRRLPDRASSLPSAVRVAGRPTPRFSPAPPPSPASLSLPTRTRPERLAFVTNDGGATWTDSSLPTDFVPTGLQCVSAELCVASGFTQSPDGSSTTVPGTMLYSSDDGATWAAASVPPGIGPLGRVSCADPTDCVASFFGDDGSSSEIIASTDGGQSWSEAAASGLPAALITGLSCPTAGACWAAGMVRAGSGGSDGSREMADIDVTLGPGAAGIVESSSDSGQTWQSQQLPQGVLMVLDITCPSDTSCYALAIQTASPGSPASFVLLANGS